jgi:hypothetical protein
MERRGGRGNRTVLVGEHRLVIAAVLRIGRALARDVGGSGMRPARSSRTSTGSSPGKNRVQLPSSWRASAMAVTPAPKAMVSPSRRRLPLRTKACQRRKSIRLCKVAPIRASPRWPSSWAGITRVSLNTSTSPARSSEGRSRTPRSARGAPPATWSIRAASRGRAGRRAMASGEGRNRTGQRAWAGALAA